MPELWDLYDKNRKPLNRKHRRGAPLYDGEYHVVVEIMTVTPDGRILVTKRHPKKHFGNMWEFTGGSVVAGETSKCGARRELMEETGLKVRVSDLVYLTTVQTQHQFYDEYLVRCDFRLEDLVLQETEVCDAKIVTLEELQEMHRTGEFVSPVYNRIIEHPSLYMKYLNRED